VNRSFPFGPPFTHQSSSTLPARERLVIPSRQRIVPPLILVRVLSPHVFSNEAGRPLGGVSPAFGGRGTIAICLQPPFSSWRQTLFCGAVPVHSRAFFFSSRFPSLFSPLSGRIDHLFPLSPSRCFFLSHCRRPMIEDPWQVPCFLPVR